MASKPDLDQVRADGQGAAAEAERQRLETLVREAEARWLDALALDPADTEARARHEKLFAARRQRFLEMLQRVSESSMPILSHGLLQAVKGQGEESRKRTPAAPPPESEAAGPAKAPAASVAPVPSVAPAAPVPVKEEGSAPEPKRGAVPLARITPEHAPAPAPPSPQPVEAVEAVEAAPILPPPSHPPVEPVEVAPHAEAARESTSSAEHGAAMEAPPLHGDIARDPVLAEALTAPPLAEPVEAAPPAEAAREGPLPAERGAAVEEPPPYGNGTAPDPIWAEAPPFHAPAEPVEAAAVGAPDLSGIEPPLGGPSFPSAGEAAGEGWPVPSGLQREDVGDPSRSIAAAAVPPADGADESGFTLSPQGEAEIVDQAPPSQALVEDVPQDPFPWPGSEPLVDEPPGEPVRAGAEVFAFPQRRDPGSPLAAQGKAEAVPPFAWPDSEAVAEEPPVHDDPIPSGAAVVAFPQVREPASSLAARGRGDEAPNPPRPAEWGRGDEAPRPPRPAERGEGWGEGSTSPAPALAIEPVAEEPPVVPPSQPWTPPAPASGSSSLHSRAWHEMTGGSSRASPSGLDTPVPMVWPPWELGPQEPMADPKPVEWSWGPGAGALPRGERGTSGLVRPAPEPPPAPPAPAAEPPPARSGAVLVRPLPWHKRLDRRTLAAALMAAALSAMAASAVWALVLSGRRAPAPAPVAAGPRLPPLAHPGASDPAAARPHAAAPARESRASSARQGAAPARSHPEARATSRGVATAALQPSPGGRAGANAWRGAHWRMTVEEILRAFPGEAVRLRPGERERVGEFVTAAGIRRVRIGDRAYVAAFLFDAAGGLAAIHLRLADRGGIGEAYDDLAARLAGQHGPAAASSGGPSASGAWTRHASWGTGESLVDLYGWESVAQESHVLALDFNAGEIRPQEQGSVVLTYRPAGGGHRASR